MKPITKEKIGWGFVSTGWISTEMAESVRDFVPDGYVAAVGSRELDKAEAYAKKYGDPAMPCKAYGSYREMFMDPDVDVVYVATPHPFHKENVIEAAECGKNILCEKPFTVNKKDAEEMFAAAKANGVFIMEGLWSRFFPAWRYVRNLIASGELGDLVSVDAATCWGGARNGQHNVDHRLYRPDLAGGSLLDAGVYSLASLSCALGTMKMPETIYSTMRKTETGVDSDVDMMLVYENGVTAHLVSSLYRRNFETHIYCEKGDITIPQHRCPSSVTIRRDRSSDLLPPLSNGQKAVGMWNRISETTTLNFPWRGHGFQFEALVVQDCLRKGLEYCPEVPPEETLINMEICDTVRRNGGLIYPFETEL